MNVLVSWVCIKALKFLFGSFEQKYFKMCCIFNEIIEPILIIPWMFGVLLINIHNFIELK